MTHRDTAAPVVALVLGAAVRPDGRPTPALRRRALHAVALWRAGQVDAILASGGVVTHPPAEAEVILRLCRAHGVPDDALHAEPTARSTVENLRLALPMLRRMGAGPVVIVTHRHHAPRALLIARRLGLSATASCPVVPGRHPGAVLRDWAREGPRLVALWLFGLPPPR